MDTNENIDWKIPKGTPVIIFTVIKKNTAGICKSSVIFLTLKMLSFCRLLSGTQIKGENTNNRGAIKNCLATSEAVAKCSSQQKK